MHVARLLVVSFVFVIIASAKSTAFLNESETPTTDDAAFQAWLAELRIEALAKGISAETLDTALEHVKAPVKKVIKRDRNQPEIKQPYAHYLKSRVSPWRKDKGLRVMIEHSNDLKAAGGAHGVQDRFVAAIWGIETNYGTVDLTYSVFNALATLSYDKRRGARFRGELFAALEIMDKGYATYDQMMGSWAGAMGQPQFMPVNYLRYAVDHDGDGSANIWSSHPDVFASIANYLKAYGWRDDQTWGRKVKLPAGGEKALPAPQAHGVEPDRVCKPFKSMGAWRDLQDWQKLGIRRLNGADLPTRNIPAALILGDEGDDEGYLVYRNFCSIMRYNPSFKYALAVGLLSDAIKP